MYADSFMSFLIEDSLTILGPAAIRLSQALYGEWHLACLWVSLTEYSPNMCGRRLSLLLLKFSRLLQVILQILMNLFQPLK